ncbi:hypothetical protein LVD17_25780 [Fulvivirga ulvae]|uniref:hypothetical protein n=1 Tax=Fulvivirga ulvae TaxID=2904245 RepID=UPI001F1710C2|nr:hypothetical protein [Fulvivirga ulvae]UII31704.1 hypothetical protein LVD17_25780 [Fulvivirga ulvae]
MKIYFQEDFVKISYDPTYNYILHEWLIPPTEEEFRTGCNQLVDAFKHFSANKVVVDTRQQGVIAGDLLEWMGTDWVTRAVAAGYTHGAIIVPSDIFASLSLHDLQESINNKVINQNFDSMSEALEWIKVARRA